MSILRASVAVCAAVLLMASLSSQPVGATSCLTGIKGLFCNEKSYAILADHLYRATKSAELVDNTEAVGSLVSKHSDGREDVEQLAQAFGALKGDSSDAESFCGKENLANLRHVAEGLRDGGNKSPKKITKAIGRLNEIVIRLIEDARRVCDPYLTGKWPKPLRPNPRDEATQLRIDHLDGVANSYLYEGFMRPEKDPSYESEWRANTLSNAVRRSELQAAESTGSGGSDLSLTEDRVDIAEQLQEYICKPCRQFVSLDEAKEVLVPFNEMLKSWYVVSTGFLDKYYENKDAYRPDLKVADGFETKVKDLAAIHQACRRFLAESAYDLAKIISIYRGAHRDLQ